MTCPNKYELATNKFPKGVTITLCTDIDQECKYYEKFSNKPKVKVCDRNCYGYCLRRG